MADDQVKRDWVQRVLGVAFPQTGDEVEQAPEGSSTRLIWQTAKEAVDGKLEQLGAALRAFKDPDLDRIAEFGLFGLTRGQNVALNKALIEYEAAAPARKQAAGGKLQGAIAEYRAVLLQHPAIGQLDNNPFGVRPALRATLGGALDRIEQAIA